MLLALSVKRRAGRDCLVRGAAKPYWSGVGRLGAENSIGCVAILRLTFSKFLGRVLLGGRAMFDQRSASGRPSRPEVRGKFVFRDGQKTYVKGVTYGTFRGNPDTGDFPDPETVEKDFAAMAAAGMNTVRVYIVPPRWLLDLAEACGLGVFVGLPWEQHIAFLDNKAVADDIVRRLDEALEPIADHPAIFAIAIGNEIPATVVRWYGGKRVARFLRRIVRMVRQRAPGVLVTYVNFPSTEYLKVPEIDLVSFNVYLEDMDRLDAYLARLHNLAGEKPLLMAEIGLDSQRNGIDVQASSIAAQLVTAFEAGVSGAFVFSWTDEWSRGGHEVLDWDFGLTTRGREPKPALAAVSKAFEAAPAARSEWPRFSVVVCSYNGSRTIGETLERLGELDYPNYEAIVVNDGSTDSTREIAEASPFKVISTENRGLSNARNTGMDAASGELIAYIDDDAYPDPQWLTYLALAFLKRDFTAVGGPNLGPPEDPDIAECIANAPGGPVQVLENDEVAEHIPGCNMSFRAEALRAVGGFDPQFRVAGDDVDLCWRIEANGGVIGFSHAAQVWHHRRPSVATYFKQQRGYARAEALLARKWASKFNRAGHLPWRGQLYGRGLVQSFTNRPRIYHGSWGAAPFQSVYSRGESVLTSLPLMPEWIFLVGLSLVLGLFGFDWPPLFLLFVAGLAGLFLSLAMSFRGALAAEINSAGSEPPRAPEWQLRAIIFWLHFVQPVARLVGRIQYRLGPWSNEPFRLFPIPRPLQWQHWSETWTDPTTPLRQLRDRLDGSADRFGVGGDFDAWDIALGQSVFAEARLVSMVEEHGHGQQLFRLRAWPVVFTPVIIFFLAFVVMSALAFSDGAAIAGSVLGLFAFLVYATAYSAASTAMETAEAAVGKGLKMKRVT
ncbi:glycosyltransferase [Tropicimonas aquimaris]|uniref:Glycosyltransferase n=1 Tax=Tropicimonas aquimaris TaxID=914152 RepID=A0ABW3IQH0_9RHOB